VHERFGKEAQFLFVYLREAHAADGWKSGNSNINDPRSQVERDLVAGQCCRELKFEFPTVVDTMDDQTAVDWAAWPERIFVIGADGKVVYAGEQGPWGFWPTEAFKRQALKNATAKKKEKKKAEMPPINLDGPSLETFLAHLLRNEPLVEVVEPIAGSPPAASSGGSR